MARKIKKKTKPKPSGSKSKTKKKTTGKKVTKKNMTRKKTTKKKITKKKTTTKKITRKKTTAKIPTTKKTAAKAKKTVKKQKKTTAGKTSPKKTTRGTASKRTKRMLLIKDNLMSQKEGLLREAELALNTLPGELNFPDMGDQATAEADRDFMLRLRDRERMLLKKIDEAVERMENNTFGICENCGNEIGIKRLEARPVTTYCIDCKIRQEEEERIAEGG
jgi:DnaK suppressor protein